MVSTGHPWKESIKTEIIDLKNPENSCPQGPSYPIQVKVATGGLVQQNVPLICGGMTDVSLKFRQECFSITDNKMTNIVNMTTARYGSSSVVQNRDLVVFGGRNRSRNYFDSIERVSIATKSSKIIGKMPFTFVFGCVLSYDQDKLIAISGDQNGDWSSATWTSSFSNLKMWEKGPSLIQKRYDFGCAIFRHLKMAIVSGGSYGGRLSSTELIQINENKVVAGKKYI